MSRYEELTVDMSQLCDGYTAPEEIRTRAREAWHRVFVMSDLRMLAGELDKDHRRDDGTWVLGWIIGGDEYYYLVVLDPNLNRVVTEKGRRAVKQEGQS